MVKRQQMKKNITYTPRFTKQELEYWTSFLIARDGTACKLCGRQIHVLNHKIEVDHIDNDPLNNPKDGSNFQLLCKPCNVKKGNRFRKGKYDTKIKRETRLFIEKLTQSQLN